jgi:plasmid stabilization system protein ParE
VSLPVQFHRLAGGDVVEAWRWYEAQRRGLGDQFLVSLEATIDRASKWPNAGTPVIRGDQDEIVERKVATHGFPYAVRYRVIDGRLVVIMAVHHQHRDPGFGNERRA